MVKGVAKIKLLKTISYRIVSSLAGFAVIYIATGSMKYGVTFGVAELIYKPVLYYIHEMIWYRKEREAMANSGDSQPVKVNPLIK